MKLTVPANQIPVFFMSMANEDAQAPKKIFGSDEQKTDENGKGLYSGKNLQAVSLDENGSPSGQDKSVTLNIRTPKPIQFGQVYRLTGQVTVSHYLADGSRRVAVSITADSIELVKPEARQS